MFRKVLAIISSNVIFYPFVSLSLYEKSHYMYIGTVDFCSRSLFILRLLSVFPTGHFLLTCYQIYWFCLLPSQICYWIHLVNFSVISFDPKTPIWFFFMLLILLWRSPVYLSHCHILFSLFKLLDHIYKSWFWSLCQQNPSAQNSFLLTFSLSIGHTFPFLSMLHNFYWKLDILDKYYPEILDSGFLPWVFVGFFNGLIFVFAFCLYFRVHLLPYVWLLMFLFSVLVF